MASNWYVVKYMPDIFQAEPRNIGIIVVGEGDFAAARFVGEVGGDKFDGRRVRGVVNSPEVLKLWISYLRHHMSKGTLPSALDTLGARGLDNYVVESRGSLLHSVDEESVQEVADTLYAEMVTIARSTAAQTAAATLDTKIRSLLFDQVRIPRNSIQSDVTYEVQVKGERRSVHFEYAYVNGHTTLMDRVSFHGPTKSVDRRVNDLLFRLEHISSQIPDLVTFYDTMTIEDPSEIERQLKDIEEFAHTVDVASSDAPSSVERVLGLETLA